MACKRKLVYFDVSDAKESSNAVIDGVVTDLSPVKKSKKDESVKYFSGQVSDGKARLRVICFQPQLHQKLNCSLEGKSAVSLVNCQVREVRGGGGSEVVMTKSTTVEASPKKFTGVECVAPANEPTLVTMNEVGSITIDQKITVVVKVMTVDPPQTVKNRDGRSWKKQDCVIGDSEGCGRVVLWEEDVGKLEEGKCYKLKGVGVRSFRGVNYLSAGKECEIGSVDDIGEIAEIEDGDLEEKGIVRKVVEGEIDGVLYSDQYAGCMGCGVKVTGGDEVLAECTKCGMVMKRSKCRKFVTARVVVMGRDGKKHTLMVFNDAVRAIVGEHAGDVKRALLSSGDLKFFVDKGDVVYSVQEL